MMAGIASGNTTLKLTDSISSPLPQGSHEIASRMRTSVLIAPRRRLTARFLAAHNFDNFRLIFRLRAFQ